MSEFCKNGPEELMKKTLVIFLKDINKISTNRK